MENARTEDQIHSAPTAGSEAGAERIRPMARRLSDRILELLEEAGPYGMTNGELAARLRGRDVTVWPRVTGLKERGKIRDSGKTRPSPATGTEMTVWILTTPDQEHAILEARRRTVERFVEEAGQEARQAAQEIMAAAVQGGLFWTEDHLARVVQEAINSRVRRLGRAAIKAQERAAIREREEHRRGPDSYSPPA